MALVQVRRIDYLDDPNAPAPNSIVPAASAMVTNDRGEILLQRRADNGLWAPPGGTMELGENISETAVREVKEETGLDVEITKLVGIYTNPRHIVAYPDGEVRQQFNICFSTRLLGGHVSSSDESTEVRFVPARALDTLSMHKSIRLRIAHYLECRIRPFIG